MDRKWGEKETESTVFTVRAFKMCISRKKGKKERRERGKERCGDNLKLVIKNYLLQKA